MYIKPQPIGVQPPSSEDAMPIWRADSGDDLVLETRATLADGETKVTPDNSILVFVLSENRFSQVYFWTGRWHDGIEEVDPVNHPGMIRIQIPQDLANTLRRGTYNFSMNVSDKLGQDPYVTLVGTLLMEYEPSSPEHNIPYKHGGRASDPL
jgi:hypothetical protein